MNGIAKLGWCIEARILVRISGVAEDDDPDLNFNQIIFTILKESLMELFLSP